MEKGAIHLVIPNCVATGFQVSPNPLGMARSRRQEVGWSDNRCHTHCLADSLGRTEDRKDGFPCKAATNNPRFQPSRNRSGKRFHHISITQEWSSRAQWNRNRQQAHSSKENCSTKNVFSWSHSSPRNDNSRSAETKEHHVGGKTLQAMEE